MSHNQCTACSMFNKIMSNILGYIIVEDEDHKNFAFVHKGECAPDPNYKPDLVHVRTYETLANALSALTHLTVKLVTTHANTKDETVKNVTRQLLIEHIYKSGYMLDILKVATETEDDDLYKLLNGVPFDA